MSFDADELHSWSYNFLDFKDSTFFPSRSKSSTITSLWTKIYSLTLSNDNAVAAFPAMLLCRKLTGGKVQIIGGVFSCAGMIGAAFSTQAWQALISNGIVTGM